MRDEMETLDFIVTGEKYDKFRKLAKELVNEAQRINAEPTLQYFGMTWNFDAAYKAHIDRIFKLRG